MLNNFASGNRDSPRFIGGDRDSPRFIGGDRDSPRFIGGNGDALELGFSVLSKVGSPGAELSLKLLKFYFLLMLILGFF